MNLFDITLEDAERIGGIVAFVVVPILVAVSRPLADGARGYVAYARATPSKADDRVAAALRWLCVGFEANADRLSRFVAALLPMASAAREAMKRAPKEGDES
jgi:hypothetical protein